MNQFYKSIYSSPFCPLLIESDEQHLLRVVPTDDLSVTEETTPAILAAHAWLDAYFSGRKPSLEDLPIRLGGTAFQRKCWQLLLEIPYGTTCTYKDIASQLAKESKTGRMSCQAVGQAISRNPIAIFIPCHRVIGTNGSLTGYAGGLELKKQLLLHEEAIKTAL